MRGKRTYLRNDNHTRPHTNVEDTNDNSDWGPSLWNTLHTISFYYPDNPTREQRMSAWNFFSSLDNLLPCPQCCEHCKQYLQENPPLVHNKDILSRWVINFHNAVNRRLGKPEWTYEQAKQKYNINNACPLN